MHIRILCFFVCLLTPCASFNFPKWFIQYIHTHQKAYPISELPKYYHILKEKYRLTHIHSSPILTLRLNENSDLNRSTYNTHISSRRQRWSEWAGGHDVRHKLGHPSHFDWRDHHYVTPVKRQGSCGGCFAFAAVGHLEFWYKKMSGHLKELSIQQALDCSGPESEGCNGGLMEDVYYHSYWNPIAPSGFDTWKGHDSVCKRRRSHPYVQVRDYVSISDPHGYNLEDDLSKHIYTYGPIPVGVHSTSTHFELYHDGILQSQHCGKEVDHAVLVVGYTPEYWIIKNSWGTTWGQNGYMYLERGTNACGINTYAAFATSVSI